MNRLTIIGNLTRDPEMRTTQSGYQFCTFTVAVNNTRRNSQSQNGNQQSQQNDATFFRVITWNKLAEICSQYLSKGRKVCVIGPVSANTYQANDGTTRVSLEVNASEVEFVSGRQDNAAGFANYVPANKPEPQAAPVSNPAPTVSTANSGFMDVESDELPF